MRRALLPDISSRVDGRRTAYRTGALWVIVVAVDGEDRDGNVEVGVFIVDGWEA